MSEPTQSLVPLNEVTQEQVGHDLLFPLFRCLDAGYKKKYVKDVWEHFQNAVKSSALTSSLPVFLEKITRKMPIQLEHQYQEGVLRIIQSGHDADIMDWLRYETLYLVMLARTKNEERKEEFRERQRDREELDTMPSRPAEYFDVAVPESTPIPKPTNDLFSTQS